VASRSDVLGHGTIGGEESLGVPRGLKPLQAPLPLAGRLVGILVAVIEVPVLAVLHSSKDLPLRRTIASQLIRNDHPRHVRQSLQQPAKELLGGVHVAPALHQDIQYMAILIDGAPQVMALPVDP